MHINVTEKTIDALTEAFLEEKHDMASFMTYSDGRGKVITCECGKTFGSRRAYERHHAEELLSYLASI